MMKIHLLQVSVSAPSPFSCSSFYIHVELHLYIIERRRQRGRIKVGNVRKHKPDEFYNTSQRFTVFYSVHTQTRVAAQGNAGCPTSASDSPPPLSDPHFLPLCPPSPSSGNRSPPGSSYFPFMFVLYMLLLLMQREVTHMLVWLLWNKEKQISDWKPLITLSLLTLRLCCSFRVCRGCVLTF